MNQKKLFLIALVSILIVSVACSIPGFGGAGTPPPASNINVETAVALTVAAGQQNPSGGVTINTPEGSTPPTAAPPTETPTATKIPTATMVPTSTVTSTPTGPSVHAVDQDTNCRSGPGPGYEILSGLFIKDGSTPLLGKYDLGGWWYVQDAHNHGDKCWVWQTTTAADGNVATVPVQPAPPFIKLTTGATPYTGSCAVAHQVEAYASISSEQSVQVTFHFEADGKPNSPNFSYNLVAGGSYSKQYNFTFSSSGTGKIRVVLTAPVNFTSNEKDFSVTCGP